jgi:hypothetical protein
MSKPRNLVDYAAIRRWVEHRHAVCGRIASQYADELPDLLRAAPDDDEDDSGRDAPRDLDRISWDELFAEFERSQLALLGSGGARPHPKLFH